jgi:1-acyl-sn-glycerol-3-phosphate acyltransferase
VETKSGTQSTLASRPKPGSREQKLIGIVQSLLRDLHPERVKFIDVTPSSRLQQDLGIDSLGRMELILRIELGFQRRLPVNVMGEADTVDDILTALEQAQTVAAPRAPAITEQPLLPAVGAATSARTLIDALDWHLDQHPNRRHLTLLQDDSIVLATLTYRELAEAARLVTAGLIERDVASGDRVAVMLPTSIEFFAAFFGILYAGAIPVPIYPPMQLSQIEDYVRRQAGILRNSAACMLITPPEGLRLGSMLRGQVSDIMRVESVASLSMGTTARPIAVVRDASATALIQYTSGSTGDPKGVVLSHDNLFANIRAIGRAIDATSADVLVSWLPLYHDMGLIGAWLGSLYFGAPFYVMSPLSFLAHPQNWLWAIHRFRATISAAPNFAFERCLNKIDDADLTGLDLSSLRFLANGAEPVSVQTLQRFCEKFKRYGFRREAMAPVYGLAENAVSVTLPPPGRGPVIDHVDRQTLSRDGRAELARGDDANAIDIVACGQPIPGHEVRIIDEFGREVGERREGRLEFRGPSATSGYFRNDAKTRELLHDGWFDSGDRAYMAGGDVFITGRAKDIIIRAGQHIYPQEIEDAIGAIAGFNKGGIAVFGVEDPAFATEHVVVLAECDETDPALRHTLQDQAQQAATTIVGAPVEEIILVPTGTVPKTSSGKIRRAAARALYLAGQLVAGRRPLRWQIMRLWIASLGPRVLRLRRLTGEVCFAAWWWVALACGVALGALAVMVLPSLKWRWAAIRSIARAMLAATGTAVTAQGLARIPRARAMLMFNHSSYTDALVLAALLPGEPLYVVKRELANQIFAGRLLRRLGALFVDRSDLASGQVDTAAITEVARQGRVLVFFPEGTFTRRPGLSEFYLGAFKVAADAALPILPGALRGTRSMLRSDQWFPRRSAISFVIGEPIMPTGTDLMSVVQLRDAVRAAILAHCGEPDLAELVKPEPA